MLRDFGCLLLIIETAFISEVRAAATEGRRVAKPLGRTPAPRLGAPGCAALRQLMAADNAATPWPNMARRAAQTEVRVSQPVLCVTLKRLGLPRQKRPFGRASRRAPMSPPRLQSDRQK